MQLRNYTISGQSRNHNEEFFSDLIVADGMVISLKALPYQNINISVMIPDVDVQLANTPVAAFVAKYKDSEELR